MMSFLKGGYGRQQVRGSGGYSKACRGSATENAPDSATLDQTLIDHSRMRPVNASGTMQKPQSILVLLWIAIPLLLCECGFPLSRNGLELPFEFIQFKSSFGGSGFIGDFDGIPGCALLCDDSPAAISESLLVPDQPLLYKPRSVFIARISSSA
jgi:hypothetical protein